ncbi:MAG: 5'-nucleotidase C-terminal domain-containing protein [Cyanobacteria bacterium J06648_16]
MGFFRFAKRSALLAGSLSLVGLIGADAARAFTLTILHNNDGESELLPSDDGFGGAAQFVGEVNALRDAAGAENTLVLSSGDNFLPGPEFNASLTDGVFYDAITLSNIGYDAIILGNHDFDFGPDILADFIPNVDSSIPYLSANLDFSGEPALQALVDAGRIAKSVVVTKGGEQIGIVGATTPNLPTISSPGNVTVGQNVQAAVQAEIDALTDAGVENIIFVSHLQGVDEDQALIAGLTGVDVAIAGGGDELLDSGDTSNLIPGDETEVADSYPITVQDADGNDVPVVTTTGQYKYVGKLVVEFENGVATVVAPGTTSDPVAVTGQVDSATQAAVVDPVDAAVESLASNVIAQSEVGLDAIRNNIRSQETNEGNLIADALLFTANGLAGEFGLGDVDVALANGGGIRNDNVIPAGDITELDTFNILPFSNFVSVIEDLSLEVFKNVLENAYSRTTLDENGEITIEGAGGTGRFAQIAGFSVEYNPTQTAIELAIDEEGNLVVDADGQVVVATPGERIINVTLDDGTPLIVDGQIVSDETITLALPNFIANGGDQYPFGDVSFTNLGVVGQQALASYISSVEGLNGLITATEYPEGGEGRIVVTDAVAIAPSISSGGSGGSGGSGNPASVPEPGIVLGLLAATGLGAKSLKRRRTI